MTRPRRCVVQVPARRMQHGASGRLPSRGTRVRATGDSSCVEGLSCLQHFRHIELATPANNLYGSKPPPGPAREGGDAVCI